MTHGRPDWLRTVDITAQTIANLNMNINTQTVGQILTAPRYGVTDYLYIDTVVNPGETRVLWDVNGAGMVYGGIIYLWNAPRPQYVFVIVNVDDQFELDIDVMTMENQHIQDTNDWIVYLDTYDGVNGYIWLKIARNWTFDQRFKLSIYLMSAAAAAYNVLGRAYYAVRVV